MFLLLFILPSYPPKKPPCFPMPLPSTHVLLDPSLKLLLPRCHPQPPFFSFQVSVVTPGYIATCKDSWRKMKFIGKWTELKNIILSDMTQKDTCHLLFLNHCFSAANPRPLFSSSSWLTCERKLLREKLFLIIQFEYNNFYCSVIATQLLEEKKERKD